MASGSGVRSAKELPNASLLAYFRDMSATPLLSPAREKELAREIATREINVWIETLSYPPIVDHLLGLVEAKLEESCSEFSALRAAATRAKKTRRKSSREALERSARKVADLIRSKDPDREIADEALAEVAHIHVAGSGRSIERPLGFATKSKTFLNYVGRVRARQHAALAARNQFVRSNLGLVVSVARRYSRGGLPLPDLIQEGNLGLLKAVARFDPGRGFRFSTYATWWIRHAIGRALADKGRTVRIPVHILEARQKIGKVERQLTMQFGRAPSEAELATASELSVTKLRGILEHSSGHAISLDEQLGEDGERERLEVFRRPEDDPPTPFDRVETGSVLGRVREILSTLPAIEQDVVKRRFGLEGRGATTLQDIADTYGLSRERIRQIQEQALGKVRRTLETEHAM